MDMDSKSEFPFEIKDAEQSEAMKKYFTGVYSGFVRVGPKGYVFSKQYKDVASHIYNLPQLRSGDVFVSSFPRSGSTWIRELVWLLGNNLNYDESKAKPIFERYVTIHNSVAYHPEMKKQLLKENDKNVYHKEILELIMKPGYERLATPPSPRYIFTHMPLSLLPPTLLDTCKVVYIARDPRDVAVSFYQFSRMFRPLGYVGDFKTFWNFFINDCIIFTPYFEILKEAWTKRHHQNMLFLFYEDVSKDLLSTIRKVSTFLNKEYSEEEMTRLSQHLSIENFRNNKSVNLDTLKQMGMIVDGEQPFIRKGKSGGWRDYFTEEMEEQANSWIRDNLRDTDLKFPSMTIDTDVCKTDN